jgi:hypothetical protein
VTRANRSVTKPGNRKKNISWRAIISFSGALIIAACLLCVAGGFAAVRNAQTDLMRDDSRTAGKPMGDHYLMLVNTALAEKMKPEMLVQFDQSPYDALAVAFSWNYDTKPAPSVAEIDTQIASWKKITKKDIWPWVYLNRIVAVDDAQKNPYTTGPYFHQIQGADLEDKTGARSAFLQVWSNSLAAARDSHNPGIVCDVEFYNNYKEYNPAELARQLGKTTEQTEQLMRDLGARMADAAAAQYPDATLWFLFTGLGTPQEGKAGAPSYLMSPAYVAMGLLEEIQKKHFRLRVLSGGEAGLGYCEPTLTHFQQQIQVRAAGFAPYLQKYRGILELGGTMTLWQDQDGRKSICPDSDAPTVEDLQPYLQLLFRAYRYNWIYGSGDQGYFAFNPHNAPRFDATIRKAKSAAVQPPAQ